MKIAIEIIKFIYISIILYAFGSLDVLTYDITVFLSPCQEVIHVDMADL